MTADWSSRPRLVKWPLTLSGSWPFLTGTALWQEQKKINKKNAALSTYPLFASVIPPFEVQDKLLPHCLVSGRWEERARGMAGTGGDKRGRYQNKVDSFSTAGHNYNQTKV